MKNLIFKLLGPLSAGAGVLGLTGSSILWNFQGRNYGLPATIVSLLLLAIGVILLRPLKSDTVNDTEKLTVVKASTVPDDASYKNSSTGEESQLENTVGIEPSSIPIESNKSASQQKLSPSALQEITDELAATDAARPEIAIVNFAPEALQAGNSLRKNKRTPGKNLTGFKDMASELFKTK